MRAGEVDVKCYGEMIRYGQVWVWESVNIKSSRADQVQNVSTGVGGEIDMLYEIKTVYNVQEIRGGFGGGRVDVDIEVTYE